MAVVVALVGVAAVGPPAPPTRPGWRPARCPPGRPRTAPGQAGWPGPTAATAPSRLPRSPRAICSLAWPGRPGWRHTGPPLTAPRLAESTLTRDQSSSPAAPSSSTSSACSRSNTPARAHSANRFQQVVTLPQPSSPTGSSAQGVEVRAMNKIAAMQARSDTVQGAPPPGDGGSSGRMRSQRASGRSRSASGSGGLRLMATTIPWPHDPSPGQLRTTRLPRTPAQPQLRECPLRRCLSSDAVQAREVAGQ